MLGRKTPISALRDASGFRADRQGLAAAMFGLRNSSFLMTLEPEAISTLEPRNSITSSAVSSTAMAVRSRQRWETDSAAGNNKVEFHFPTAIKFTD
ncbi:hypothetical protein PoB_005014700 [Plakobranchus ocellatus]|uniref:Uncharacterized protein n=1 Tax=Plakobranchus ocellatus TaxID=259542 RepID=A0AAV4BX40_9GAST|nr:hypothetical protein PoB_005014700 [Plakobranchus ocellatus]